MSRAGKLVVATIAAVAVVGTLRLRVVAQPAAPAPTPRQPAAAHPRAGINLNGPSDWNSELPFVDVFHLSRRWISQRQGAGWGQGPELTLDRHGWVTKLDPGCWAETLLCTIQGGHYPDGDYTVLYEGEGRSEFTNAAVVSAAPGRMVVKANPARGAMFLKITATNPQNYIRNIRVIMPGFEQTYQQEPFHPLFLKRWQGMACIRFMDWMKTNGSTISTWADRPTPEDATYTTKGVPLEVMIDLANRLKAAPWFCIPHQVDDDYVRHFAAMVKERLDPSLKVYVEYSNEVWNSQFVQNHWAGEQGQKLGFADKPWEAAWRYNAYRSVQIFGIWEQVFGGTDRLVRVLATQSANPYVSQQILQFQNAYQHADALAVAPYIALIVPAKGGKLNADTVAQWSVDQALDYLANTSLPQSIHAIQAQKEIADKYGLKLVAYEGGQHMVGIHGGENNNAMTQLFQAANANPRMGEIYDKYFDAWTKAGGDLFCYFSSVGTWSKWGSWGVMQYYDDDPAKSPKFMALMRWAKQCGQPVNAPE